MTFIYFVTNSAWNPNTWAILCGILAVFLIVVLLTIYFIFRRLHIDLTILRTVFQEQKHPSHPATLTISDIPPGSETADLPQVPASAAKTKKQHTLLIIEDHLEIRLYLKLIFSNEYNLLMAENGEEGFKKACEGVPDLIITDIIMPVMDGFAFMEEFKKRESIRNIPIVVATTENDFETEKRCLELGVWDFIPKIFQPEIIRFRVFNTIKRSMAHSLEHDKLTGLYTVQKFSQRVQVILEENADTKFTFVRLDIERFKMINNFYGIDAGDRLLVHLAGLIEKYWQNVKNSVFGRVDGDVFGICFEKDDKKLNDFILYMKQELKKYQAAYWKPQWAFMIFRITIWMCGISSPAQRLLQNSAKVSTWFTKQDTRKNCGRRSSKSRISSMKWIMRLKRRNLLFIFSRNMSWIIINQWAQKR